MSHGSASGSVTPVAIPTRPNPMKPAVPTQGRATDAHPRTAPIASDTTMMPTTSAALSFVPKSDTASCFSDAAKRLMNSVPMVSMSDGPSLSALTTSVTANATAAASTPATAALGPEITSRSGDDRVGLAATVVIVRPPGGAR